MGKVIAQLQGLVAEAYRLAAVDIHDLGMSLCTTVAAQAEVGCSLLVDRYICGILYHQRAIIVLCVKVLAFINDVTVFILLDLPFLSSLAGGLVYLGHFFPNFNHLFAVFIVPENRGELAYSYSCSSLKHCTVIFCILCGHLKVAAQARVGGEFRGAFLDPAYLSRIGNACIVSGNQLHIPCEIASLIGYGMTLSLDEHAHFLSHTKAEGA